MADENKCCEGHHKCWCKGIALIIIAILGFFTTTGNVQISNFGLIWPVVVVIVGFLDLFGICCCCGMKK